MRRFRFKLTGWQIFICLFYLSASPAYARALNIQSIQASSLSAQIIRSSRLAGQIAGLKFSSDTVVIRPIRLNAYPAGRTQLEGFWSGPEKQLAFFHPRLNYRETVTVDRATKKFKINVFLDAEVPEVVFISKTKGSKVREEALRFHFKSRGAWNQWRRSLRRAGLKRAPVRSAWSFVPFIGLTRLSYTQPGFSGLSQLSVSSQLSVRYAPPEQAWSLGGNIYFTALPFRSDLTGVSLRTLGANVSVSYAFSAAKAASWRFALATGGFYTTTFAAGLKMGYKNLFGAQIYPALSRIFSNGQSITGYFKYSPVSSTFSLFSAGSFEVALGTAYQFDNWLMSLDLARLQVRITAGLLRSESLTLGAGIRF